MTNMVDTLLEEQWMQVGAALSKQFGEGVYRSWIAPLSWSSPKAGVIVCYAPSRFMKDWVIAHYREAIAKQWKSINPEIRSVDIDIQGAANAVRESIVKSEPQATAASKIEGMPDEEDEGLLLDPRFTFDQFVVGKPNELAYAAAQRVAESHQPTFNPLFLYGGVGLGKTHLMHAIAWHIQTTQPTKKVIYLSAEKFMYQFIRSLRYKDTVSFKERFRSVDVLMIDDVQFIGGKETTQEEFFHTFNALVDHNRQLIISADKSPSDLEKMEDRLKSRLGWGLVADIHPTTYELRLGILQAKLAGLGMPVPKEVMEFLALRITSNVRELEGALTRLVAHSSLVGRPITAEGAQEVLRDLLRSNDRRLTVEDIQQHVCEFYRVKLADMVSASRQKSIVTPRQVAMYLCKQLTTLSMPDIGRRFGGRDHTTVLHTLRKIQGELKDNPELARQMDVLEQTLRS